MGNRVRNDGPQYTHLNGRVCRPDDHGVWSFWDADEDVLVACPIMHPDFIAGEEKSKPRTPATPEAEYIVQHLVRQWLDLFLEKNAKYASVNKSARLGPEGHIPDINRKNGILIDRLWAGNPTVGEDTKEVVFDMIGHLMLLVADMEM